MKRLAVLLLALTLGLGHADELADAKTAYGKADLALNNLWKILKETFDAENFAELQKGQRAWVKHRDYVADFQMKPGTQGDPTKRMGDLGYLEAAAGMTEARVAFLAAWKDMAATTKTGSWTDSFGGRIDIVDRDGKLFFRAGCVRGPTYHVGDLAGVAATNGNLAHYTDRDVAPQKVKDYGETWLYFHLSNLGVLEVVGANTGHYHGARAYFDGKYRRTGGLDEGDMTKVIIDAKESPDE